ncbi:MAG: D-alanine--D-alanine ligase [Tissierellia bacterium]|nr:D-alanine--D-alanine ligase [Tissierellia bacterium]
MKKIKLALVCGGRSAEREVSLMGAREILAALNYEKYDVRIYGIDSTGHWKKQESLEGIKRFSSFDQEEMIPSEIMRELQMDTDVVFPILHGPYGEDGRIQGFFETLGVRYVGCGILNSAILMDKEMGRKVMREAGIPVVSTVTVYKGNGVPEDIDFPAFVKPSSMGSSIGTSKVKNRTELLGALQLAFLYDDKALIEEFIDGREVECSVLNGKVSGVGEILPAHEFYDYEAKYYSAASKTLIPADLDPDIVQRIQDISAQAAELFGLDTLSRIDFFVRGEEIFLNEINTMPGFTTISMYAKLWQAMGMSYSEILDTLIELALRR